MRSNQHPQDLPHYLSQDWKLFYTETMVVTTSETLDWSGLPLIHREPGKMGGAPNIAGMRITPETIVDHWEGGMDIPEILSHFGGVSYDQAYAILEYAQMTGQLERPFKT